MNIVHYFAFGSNMSAARLADRIPLSRAVAAGRLDGWAFRCDKTGLDGSAKANIAPVADATVWGVVFTLPAGQLQRLDAIEGGYRRVEVDVWCQGRTLRCHTYTSDRLTTRCVPFDWYKALMVTGAREHGLPADHVAMLEALPQRPA